jgi:hypothetical protein
MMILAYTLFAVGAFLCLLNFYLSFLRYPLYRLFGREYQHASGVPLFGSLLLVIAVTLLYERPLLFWSGITLALLDTGGLHWFAGIMLWTYFFHRDRM